MNQKIIIAVLTLLIVVSAGYWHLANQSNQVASSETDIQAQPTSAQQTRQVILYHYTGEASVEYQTTQKTIASVPQIADATLKELLAMYLPNIRSEYIGISIQDGVATVNFRSGASAYLDQAPPGISAKYTNSIKKTLLQFSTITSVQFAIDGQVITNWDA